MTWSGEDVAQLLSGGGKNARLKEIVASCSSLQEYVETYHGHADYIEPRSVDLADLWAIPYGSEQYPKSLASIRSAPAVLFGRGDASALTRCVAVVGTRRASRIGERAAQTLAEAARETGFSVVSGLAAGVDRFGHEAALANGVPTVGVLACGADLVYPAEHADLADRIVAAGGAIISEQLPGVTVSPQRLQMRNRIITGLAWVVMIGEGGADSRGTLGAMRSTLDAGRPLIVPQVRGAWRSTPGAWILNELAKEDPDFGRLGLKYDSVRTPIANAVCEDPQMVVDALRVFSVFSNAAL
jgi:DNA protecting protein DprA